VQVLAPGEQVEERVKLRAVANQAAHRVRVRGNVEAAQRGAAGARRLVAAAARCADAVKQWGGAKNTDVEKVVSHFTVNISRILDPKTFHVCGEKERGLEIFRYC
jgi:hypothetical protein